MEPYIYTATDSAQYRHGQRVYARTADVRSAGPWSGSNGRVWASLRADGAAGCYVFACDLSTVDEYEAAKQRRADLRADTVRP